MIGASDAVLAPDAALVVIADYHDGRKGKYFVVNPVTGAIVRGPVPLTSYGMSGPAITVINASTVLIAHRSDNRLEGVFVVVDPQTAAVKVPETIFAPSTPGVIHV